MEHLPGFYQIPNQSTNKYNIGAFTNSRLIKAVKENDHVGVTRALQDGADANTCIPWGRCKSYPLLTAAIGQGNVAIVTALLAGKPDVEMRGDYWAAPLAMATVMDHTNIVAQLLDYGASCNSKDSWGATAVHLAAAAGDINTIQVLHQRGGNLEDEDSAGCTPLHRAAYVGHRPMCEWLIRHGVNAGVVNKRGATSADRAESQRHKYNIEESQKLKHLIADLRSYAAKQKIQMQHIQELKKELEHTTSSLLGWIEANITDLKDHHFPNSVEGVHEMILRHPEYKGEERLSKSQDITVIELLLSSINEKLYDIYQAEYIPRNGHQLHNVKQKWEQLEGAENDRKDALLNELKRQETLQLLAERFEKLIVQCSAYIEKKFQLLLDPRYNGGTESYEEIVGKQDIYVKQIEIEEMTRITKNLVSENYHNGDRICKLMKDIQGRWEELLEKNEKYLENCHQLQSLLKEAKTISSHIDDLEEFFQGKDYGKTLVEVENLLRKSAQKKSEVLLQFENFSCQNKAFEALINREDRAMKVLKINRKDLKSKLQNILKMAEDHQQRLEKKRFQIQMQHIQELKGKLEQVTSSLLGWIEAKISDLKDHRFSNSVEGVQELIQRHQDYKGDEKLSKNRERLKIEQLFLSINKTLITINEAEYIPKNGHKLQNINQIWEELEVAENYRMDALLKELNQQEKLQQLAEKFANLEDLCGAYIDKNIYLLHDPKYNGDLEETEEILKKKEIHIKQIEIEEMAKIAENLVSQNYCDADRICKLNENIQRRWKELLEINKKYLANCLRLKSILNDAKTILSDYKRLEDFFQEEDCGKTLAEVEDLLIQNEQKKTKANVQFQEFESMISKESIAMRVLQNKKQDLRSKLQNIMKMAKDHQLRLEKKRDSFKSESHRKSGEDSNQQEQNNCEEELKIDLKELETHKKKKGIKPLLEYIYKTWPPKNKKHTIPSLSENEKVQKVSLRTALKHYHPDKQDAVVHGIKWIKLTEEITKALNEKYKNFQN